ncbi:MAG: hypothetical protein FWG87_05625 [Defluviitaleaceae bacterium]|nr:hypothetical protein [Defluviitaleaceae bacterium]
MSEKIVCHVCYNKKVKPSEAQCSRCGTDLQQHNEKIVSQVECGLMSGFGGQGLLIKTDRRYLFLEYGVSIFKPKLKINEPLENLTHYEETKHGLNNSCATIHFRGGNSYKFMAKQGITNPELRNWLSENIPLK